jgi:hypothetical protein
LGYTYKVECKKGRENRVADALSRATHSKEIMAISQAVPVWMDQVIHSYEEDPHCLELLSKLSIDCQAASNYSLENGILRYKTKLYIGLTGNLR